MTSILFFNEDVKFNLLHKKRLRSWIEKIIHQESNKDHFQINFIFCSDAYLHQLNKEYLQHDSFTDIITFDYTEKTNQLESEIYISIDRIRENARLFKVSLKEEIRRVMIHGILHLLGFKDETKDQRQKMREKENEFLTLYQV
jgi:probable rRNA maturation factor